MANFYHRYKDLFLLNPPNQYVSSPYKPPITHSSVFQKPLNQQKHHYSLFDSYKKPYIGSLAKPDRFQTEVVSKFERLNRQQMYNSKNKHRLIWPPQIKQNQNMSQSFIDLPDQNPEQLFDRTFKKNKMVNRNQYTPMKNSRKLYQHQIIEPASYHRSEQEQPDFKRKTIRIKTQGSSSNHRPLQEAFHQPVDPHSKTVKKSQYRLNYQQPQHDNQYEFVGRRINNLKQINISYHEGRIHQVQDPTEKKMSGKKMIGQGYNKQYLDVLVRRIKSKEKIQERRQKLGNLFKEELNERY